MRHHRFLIALFALGTIGGFASGFHHLRHRGEWECHRSWMEERASRTCTPCPTSAEAPPAARPEAPPPSEPR